MFKMDKNNQAHISALITTIRQCEIIKGGHSTTRDIMDVTGRSRSWCINLMRELEGRGIIEKCEYQHRPNRTGFAYRVTPHIKALYEKGFYRLDYIKFTYQRADYYAQAMKRAVAK